jgi:hypothetical protein
MRRRRLGIKVGGGDGVTRSRVVWVVVAVVVVLFVLSYVTFLGAEAGSFESDF